MIGRTLPVFTVSLWLTCASPGALKLVGRTFGGGASLDIGDQCFQCLTRQIQVREPYRGKRGHHKLRHVDIVEADNRHITRRTQTCHVEPALNADGGRSFEHITAAG